jgi:hypothetical protein
MAKTARIEVRTDPEREALLKQAASLTNQTLGGVFEGSNSGLVIGELGGLVGYCSLDDLDISFHLSHV